MEAVKRWRAARQALAKSHTYENAVELQVAERNLRIEVRKSLQLMEGGKHETGLRHRD